MKRGQIQNSNLRIFATQLILGLMFIILTFISFYQKENGDINVVIFGTLLYLPYVIILCIYNGLTIRLFEGLNKKIRILNYCIPTVPLLIWFLISDNIITIRYWDLETKEFTIALTVLLLTNVTGYFVFQKTLGETASS